MTNAYYNATGNPTHASTGASSTQRAEFALIEDGFDAVEQALDTIGAGNVSGPVSSVNSNFAQFNGTTGAIIKDGGLSLSTSTSLGTSNTLISSQGAVKSYVDTKDATLLPKAGGTMTGLLTLSGAPSSSLHAATKTYVDTGLATKQASLGYTPVDKAGDTGVGALSGTSFTGVLRHSGSYFILDPYNGTYDDGGYARCYWDGNSGWILFQRSGGSGPAGCSLKATAFIGPLTGNADTATSAASADAVAYANVSGKPVVTFATSGTPSGGSSGDIFLVY